MAGWKMKPGEGKTEGHAGQNSEHEDAQPQGPGNVLLEAIISRCFLLNSPQQPESKAASLAFVHPGKFVFTTKR